MMKDPTVERRSIERKLMDEIAMPDAAVDPSPIVIGDAASNAASPEETKIFKGPIDADKVSVTVPVAPVDG